MNPSIALSHCQLKTGKELYSKKLQQFYIHSVITGGRESQKKKKIIYQFGFYHQIIQNIKITINPTKRENPKKFYKQG
jgi:hypothetical protein